jgi:hypothetical protein
LLRISSPDRRGWTRVVLSADGGDRGSEVFSAAGRAEVVFLALIVLSLVLLPVQVLVIYSGLPAHPLFLHVPVIFIPLLALAALAVAVRPELGRGRVGLVAGAGSVVMVAGTFLTAGAGRALRKRLFGGGGFGGRSQQLVASHAHWATILEYIVFAFAIVFVLTLAAERARIEQEGFGRFTSLLARPSLSATTRVVSAVLAVIAVATVVRVGDLGAKAVWQNRLNGPGAGVSGFGNGGPTGFGGSNGSSSSTP